jgi:hypothetical protein
MYRAPVFTASSILSQCDILRLILRLLNQQQVAHMYNVFGRWILSFVLFSWFYCNNGISNVAEHYP